MLGKFFIVSALLVSLAMPVHAEDLPFDTVFTLTVDEGFPLQVVVTDELPFKKGEPVHGRVIAPVYAFDREVIPAGTRIEGKIDSLVSGGKWKRFFRIIRGDFTPPREPRIAFHNLILPNGNQIPIETAVVAGNEELVQSGSDGKKGELENAWVASAKASKMSWLKNFLWSLSPYRPQSVPSGTMLTAILLSPLEFGEAVYAFEELESLGSQAPAGTVLSTHLVTPLDSRRSRVGDPIEAVLTRPLFSEDKKKILYPVGSTVRGEVTHAKAAGKLHKHGELAVKFTSIELPGLVASAQTAPQAIEGRIATVLVTDAMDDVRIEEDGKTRISESKMRFLQPAYAAVKAGRAVGDTGDSFDAALLSAYQSKVTKSITRSDSTFGLTGSISGAMIPPVGIGMSVYGVARSVYSNFLGKGRDIVFPIDTPIEIELDSPESE